MRATSTLQEQLADGRRIVHAKQWSALWRGMDGLVGGGQLWLMALARSLPVNTRQAPHQSRRSTAGQCCDSRALPKLCAVLAKFLLADRGRPIMP